MYLPIESSSSSVIFTVNGGFWLAFKRCEGNDGMHSIPEYISGGDSLNRDKPDRDFMGVFASIDFGG